MRTAVFLSCCPSDLRLGDESWRPSGRSGGGVGRASRDPQLDRRGRAPRRPTSTTSSPRVDVRTDELVAADRHRALADGAVGGLAQRAVEQLVRAAEDQLVQVEGADDGRQRGAELLADAARARVAGRRRREPAPQPGHGEQRLEAAGAPAGALLAVAGRPRRGRSRRPPRGGRAAARPRAPARRRHRCRPGAASGRRRRRRRRCARRGRRCWRRWRRRPGGRARAAGCSASGASVPAEVGRVDARCPAASTTPGLPTPTPSTGRSVERDQARRRARCTRSTASSPVRPCDGELVAGQDLAGEVDHRADHAVVGREVEATMCAASAAEADQRRRLADPALRPGRRAPRAGPRRPARRPGRRR